MVGISVKGKPTGPVTAALTLFAVMFALLVFALLAGCTDTSVNNATGVQATVGTHEVTDSVGRNVSIPESCNRIAALDSFSAEAIVMAGAGPLLVAAPNGVVSDVVLNEMYPQLADIPAPMSGGTVNIESLSALKPDVVLIKESLYNTKDELAKLDKLNIPYLVVSYTSIEEQIAALTLIGSILPEDQVLTMGKIVSAYRDGVSEVEERAALVPDDERVRVYHSISQVVITDGSSSLGADWISRTGAIDVSAGESATAERGDYQATLEQVFVWDPDIVICNDATAVDYLLTNSKWEGLRAVRENRVYPIPIGATRWGQRGSVETWFAMIWLGKLAYPEYFDDLDLHREVVDFYENVLGITVDDSLYEQMLAGKDMRKIPTAS